MDLSEQAQAHRGPFQGKIYRSVIINVNLREKKLGRHINTDLIFSPDHGGAHLSRQLHLAFKNGKMKRNATMKSDPTISGRVEKIGCTATSAVPARLKSLGVSS